MLQTSLNISHRCHYQNYHRHHHQALW